MSAAASASASRFSAVERLLPSQVRPVVHEELLEVPGDRLVLDDDACVAIPKYAIRRPLSSMAAQVGLAGGAAYSATKASLEAMTRSWAAEFSPDVRVNAIAPGPMYTGGAAPDRTGKLGETTLLKRAAQPEEIAAAVAFLVSPDAAYFTGATIAADGGRTAI